MPQPPRRRRSGAFWFAVVGLPLALLTSCAVIGVTLLQNLPPATSLERSEKVVPATQEPVTTSEVAAAEETTAEPAPSPSAPPSSRTYKGRGTKVLKLRSADSTEPWLVTLAHRGSSNFIVIPIDSMGNEDSYLVNEIGDYRGTVLMNVEDDDEAAALKIQADGPWTITLKPVSTARRWATPKVGGKGDDVLILAPATSGLTIMTARHSGSSNFVVSAYQDDSRDLLINEIGNWRGEVPLPSGTLLVEVNADGPWAFTKE